LKRFNREAKFSTWLYRIAFNTAITYKRKQKKQFSNIEDTKVDETIGDEIKDNVNTSDQQKFINKALQKLLPADVTVITLFYFKEFSLEEISNVTGMKINAIKVKLFRARKRLADELSRILAHETQTLLR